MARFEKRHKFENFFYTKTMIGVLSLVVILFTFSVVSVFEKRHEAKENALSAQHEVETLSQHQAKTQQSIDNLHTDAGVEEAIRNKYRAAKDGEGLVVIMDPDQNKDSTTNPEPVQETWWQKFTDLFK